MTYFLCDLQCAFQDKEIGWSFPGSVNTLKGFSPVCVNMWLFIIRLLNSVYIPIFFSHDANDLAAMCTHKRSTSWTLSDPGLALVKWSCPNPGQRPDEFGFHQSLTEMGALPLRSSLLGSPRTIIYPGHPGPSAVTSILQNPDLAWTKADEIRVFLPPIYSGSSLPPSNHKQTVVSGLCQHQFMFWLVTLKLQVCFHDSGFLLYFMSSTLLQVFC